MKIQQIRELVNIPDREIMVSFSGRVVSGRDQVCPMPKFWGEVGIGGLIEKLDSFTNAHLS